MTNLAPSTLVELDLAHLIHPQHNRTMHLDFGPVIITEGRGAVLKDIDGKRYIDGLAGLWNVTVGHGRAELANAAAEQMKKLAYFSAYTGMTNIPAIELAAKMAEIGPANLNAIYFTTGGAESNESAIKTARFYWKQMGYANKVKIISRRFAYHGVTAVASQATGMPSFWKDFEPHAPGFIHVAAPYPYRFTGDLNGKTVGQAAAQAVEDAILAEGPDTVAAFIGEPIMGAGGVIIPPDDYWPRVRQMCDKYDVLIIADEIITGFGRTGQMWGLANWGVQPDMMTIAKGITSGYLPLGGVMLSDKIRDLLHSLPKPGAWMHAATYSAHPTCCAVALKNLEIIEQEGLVERARVMGERLQAGVRRLAEHPLVGEGRGMGMVAALELVKNRATKEPHKAEGYLAARVRDIAQRQGLILRAVRDILCIAPPLVITEAELDEMLSILGHALDQVAQEVLTPVS
ncbi:MAG: aminotransferase class III-fold pyridoxal phosphate-dependent enzyme [Anaerolineae bacterium]|nr:aminotransferase class III-fold pyridoxal phosphate-dependent enzyme [Anaerolineae bacterium]